MSTEAGDVHSMHANYRIDLPHLRAQRALSDVINGKSIRAACREHHTSGKDFDSVLHGYFQKIRVHLHPDIYQDLGLQKKHPPEVGLTN